jgi:hypothetical protein
MTMSIRRLLPLCLLALLVWNVRADDDLPPDAKKLVEENEKTSEDILKKAEDALKKAEAEHQKVQEEVKTRKEKLVAKLEELAKSLEKQGKTNQAKAVAEAAEEIKTGRIAGAQPDPGTMVNFRGQNGKTFLFEVTGNLTGTVWGSDSYTDDSAIATAAVHAGILKDGEKGAVKVTVLGGEQAYTGTTRNGVTTNNYGPWQGSYKLEKGKRARKVGGLGIGGGGGVAMADPGTVQTLRGQNGKTFLFEVTGNANGSVWGDGIYTDDSSLATAAVHAGVLKNGEKGIIKVTILPGEATYTPSMRNGVTSEQWDDWGGSFKVEAVKK